MLEHYMHCESIGILPSQSAHCHCVLPLYFSNCDEKLLMQRILDRTPPPHLVTAVHLGIQMYALHQYRRGTYFVFKMIPVEPQLNSLLLIVIRLNPFV